MISMHGGRVVARALKAQGVTHLFTLCGGHIQAIYDGCLDENIRVVDTRHEQTAGHAADGWARVTGRPGVCAVTAGPGVTNVVTAVANAQRAGVPMIVLGGAGPQTHQHMGSLQEMEHVDLMRSITRWSATVHEARRIPELVDTAFRMATGGVPGPVFLELPLDVLMESMADPGIGIPGQTRSPSRAAADLSAVQAAVDVLRLAERPMLVVGSQIRWSRRAEALVELLEAFPVPTFLNGLGRGALPPHHPCFFRHTRKEALEQADVVVILGTPMDFRLGYGQPPVMGEDLKVIQVDLDGTQLGHNRAVTVGMVGDSGLVLEAMALRLARPHSNGKHAWLEHLRAREEDKQSRLSVEMQWDVDPPHPLRVCAEVARLLKPDTIVVGDGGDFVATAAYAMPIHQLGCWLDPGPLGTLGVGPGYAMAAKLARPSSNVVILYGDGAFGLHAMEFEALVRQDIKVVGVVGNDAAWTQIRRTQVELYGPERAIATSLSPCRYDKVVEAMGGHGEYVERTADLPAALKRAFASNRPALVNVRIGASEFRKGAISV